MEMILVGSGSDVKQIITNNKYLPGTSSGVRRCFRQRTYSNEQNRLGICSYGAYIMAERGKNM